MTDKTNNEKPKEVVAEIKVSMYCNACERAVARVISKIKGVEKFTTDMNTHKVIVIGQFDPKKVVKKLKKKTGKKIELISSSEDKKSEKEKEKEDKDIENPEVKQQNLNLRIDGCCLDDETLMMFNDENANACSTM